jgi:hypothetical protein
VEPDREDRLEQLVREHYERTPDAAPGLHARILQGLDQHDAAARRGTLWSWWWRPAALRLAPAAVLVAACVLLAAGAWLGSAGLRRAWRVPHRDSSPTSALQVASLPGPGAPHAVAFMLVAPGVKHVALVGEFNGWDPLATPLVRVGRDGPWVTTVSLPPGRHVYGFVLDGSRWMPDPGAPLAPDDGFGAPNSVVIVGTEGPL